MDYPDCKGKKTKAKHGEKSWGGFKSSGLILTNLILDISIHFLTADFASVVYIASLSEKS